MMRKSTRAARLAESAMVKSVSGSPISAAIGWSSAIHVAASLARQTALAAVASFALLSTALAESNSAVPPFASADFGWQSNVGDWQAPPPGHGHGPIKNDPAHPYTSNYQGGLTGTQPTKRIGDAKDPVLKPWAAAQMQASNDAALRNEMGIPFAAQARCYPAACRVSCCFPSSRSISSRPRPRSG
jgi:hypothetical protein